MSRLFFLVPIALAGALSLSCSDSAPNSSSDAAVTSDEVFLASAADLCAYPTWTKYDEPDGGGDAVLIPDASADGGLIHASGGRIEYINKAPPHGSTEFPVGTIIVKVIPGQEQIFAMAKRGGNYNTFGPGGAAINWEWFELSPTDCAAGVVWSGAFPPMNQSYGGAPDSCNQCHSGYATTNDYVASPKILLKDF